MDHAAGITIESFSSGDEVRVEFECRLPRFFIFLFKYLLFSIIGSFGPWLHDFKLSYQYKKRRIINKNIKITNLQINDLYTFYIIKKNNINV